MTNEPLRGALTRQQIVPFLRSIALSRETLFLADVDLIEAALAATPETPAGRGWDYEAQMWRDATPETPTLDDPRERFLRGPILTVSPETPTLDSHNVPRAEAHERWQRLMARADRGLCAVDQGWCITHNVEADYGHYVDQHEGVTEP